jgi:hypothetical protein
MAQKELSPDDWTEELNAALQFRRKFGLEDKWSELEKLLLGTHISQASAGPNILLSTLDALSASLNVPHPYLTVKATRQDTIEKARYQESVDNMLIDKMKMKREVDRAITSTFLWGGAGILKIGYDSEYGWDETLDPRPDNPLGLTFSMFDRKANRIEFGDIEPGMPWIRMVLPHDFLVPWGTIELDSAPWCAHRVVRHIESIREDTKYERSVTRKLQPNMSMEDFVKSYSTVTKPYRLGQVLHGGVSQKAEYVELWEIRDRRTGKIKVMSIGHNEWLRNDHDALQINGLPFVSLSFIPKTRSFWTTSDAHYLRYHQAELSDIAIQTAKQRRLNLVKFFYDQNAFDEEDILRITSSEVGAGIPVKGGFMGNPQTPPILPLSVPNANLSLYQDAEAIRRNAREQVGFSRNQVGEYEQTGRRTAYEAAQVAQAAGLRLDRRQAALRDLYVQAFKIINPIIHQNWKLPRIVQILDPKTAQALFVPVTGEHLKGDYDYKIGFSVGGEETLQERRQTALSLFTMAAQMPQIFDPVATAQWLARAINDPEFSAIFKPGVLDGQAGSTIPGLPAAAGAAGGSQPR